MPGFSNAPNPLRPQPGSTPQSPPGGEPAPFRPVAPVARPIRQGGKSRRRTQKAGRQGPPDPVVAPHELRIPLPLNLIAPPGFQADPARGALIATVPGTPAPPGFSTTGGRLYYPAVPGYRFFGVTMDRPGALLYHQIIGGRRRKRSTRRRR
jgi:hypothetical protein